jgi:hypothetical protein
MSLLIETQKQLTEYISKYSNANIAIKYINIEAPLNVLKERFEQRKVQLSKKGIDLNYSYDGLLLDIYNNYHENKFIE